MKIRKEKLNENQRRIVSVALAAFDELLCEIELWIAGREGRGIIYIERNDIPPQQKDSLRRQVGEARKLLGEAHEELGLKVTEVRGSRHIWSRCCGMRDTLSELAAKHIQGYGKLPMELARYMDNLSARLVRAIDRLMEEAKTEK